MYKPIELPKPSSSKRWIDEKEAAEIVGLSVHTLRQDRFHGRGFPYYKRNRRILYRLDELIQAMESCRIEPGVHA